MYVISREDHHKFVKPIMITRWERVVNPSKYLKACPYKINDVMMCIEMGNICYKCLRFYAYCRNLTGIGRV